MIVTFDVVSRTSTCDLEDGSFPIETPVDYFALVFYLGEGSVGIVVRGDALELSVEPGDTSAPVTLTQSGPNRWVLALMPTSG
jgi:hypothetical protein